MYHLSSLVSQLKKPDQSVIVANGRVVWLVWQGKLSDTVGHTLSGFGGWPLVKEKEQALWFFLDNEVLKGLARLYTWSKINPLALFTEVFPANLLIASDFSWGIAIDTDLLSQNVDVPKDFKILIAPNVRDDVRSIPGLKVVDFHRSYLPAGAWARMNVDVAFDYSFTLSWFVFIKPLGNPLDHHFSEGWRAYFNQLKDMFDQFKIPYLYTDDLFLILHCTTYQSLQSLCLEIMQLIDRNEGIWPCVILGIERGDLRFDNRLPQKIPVSWDYLEANYIHLPLKTVYYLGRAFTPLGTLSVSKKGNKITDFVKIGRRQDDVDGEVGRLKIFLPSHAMDGEHPPCFYCGLRSHHVGSCPSRLLLNPNSSIADSLAGLDFDRIGQAIVRIDEQLNADPLETLKNGLQGAGDTSIVMASWFEINVVSQLRMVRILWRSKGRYWPKGLRELVPQEADSAWSALHRFRNGDLDTAMKNLSAFAHDSPRHFKAKTLMGFIYMERGQYKQALGAWKEAKDLSLTPMHQSYHIFLQARLHEVTLEYDKAIALYQEARKISSGMHEARYRQAACLVKLGFSEQALGIFLELIEEDPHFFNMILIDPELERGHLHLMAALWRPWVVAEKVARTSLEEMDSVAKLVEKWFTPEHPAYELFNGRLRTILEHQGKENFVHLVRLAKGCATLSNDIHKRVEKDIEKFYRTCKQMHEELKRIQAEVSWYPFSKLWRGFDRDFNLCIRELNEIGHLNLQESENFKRAHECMQTASDALQHLRDRLKGLLLLRDSVLFVLLLGKNFLWIESACLAGLMLIMPLLTMWGIKLGQSWGYELNSQKWLIRKVLMIVISIFASGIAAVWTTIRFEKKRKIFLCKHQK